MSGMSGVYVSTDPETEARVMVQVEAATEAVKAAQRALKTAYSAADKRRCKKALSEAENVMIAARTLLPKKVIVESKAIEWLLSELAEKDEALEAEKVRFLGNFTNDPMYALEWNSHQVVKAYAVVKFCYTIKRQIAKLQEAGTATLANITLVLVENAERLNEDILNYSLFNSTSISANATNFAYYEGLKEFARSWSGLPNLVYECKLLLGELAKQNEAGVVAPVVESVAEGETATEAAAA
jgi:hypothetical protein